LEAISKPILAEKGSVLFSPGDATRGFYCATLPVHRKSIATLLGMTHETFYRTAKELEDDGMVRFDGQRIEILDRCVLEALME